MNFILVYVAGFFTVGLLYGNAMLYCRRQEKRNYWGEMTLWQSVLATIVYPTRYDGQRWIAKEDFFDIHDEKDEIKFVLGVATLWPIQIVKSAVTVCLAIVLGLIGIVIAIIGGAALNLLVEIILEVKRKIARKK